MDARESLDPKSSLWDLIAVQLRRHREEHRQSGSTLGLILDLDRSSVSRLESGQVKLLEKHAKALDREWGTADLFDCLVYYAKSGHNTEWYQAHLDMEGRSSELRIWELSWVPGLFQTEEYARAVYEAVGLEEIDRVVERRMARQEVLSRKPRPLMWVFLDQGVLDQPVGGPEVMRAQLSRLLELAQMPNITIRVVPRSAGAHVGRDGSFKIMTVRSADTAYVEACGGDVDGGGGRLVVDSTDVHAYGVRFARIGDRALPLDASLEMIHEIRESLQ